MKKISNELYEKLLKLSKKDNCQDDLDSLDMYDRSGGNFDDAYGIGVDDGKIRLAAEIIADVEKQEQS